MDKIRKFDDAFREVYKDVFLYRKISTSILCSIGTALMLIPVNELKDDFIGMVGLLLTGCLLSALGIQQYMLAYLTVREDGKMVLLREILKYMPVTRMQLRKVRLGYLNRYCLRLGAVSFVLQQFASMLGRSFGWESICFAVCQAALVWLLSMFLVLID